MAKAVHTMVMDLDRSVGFYREAFGLAVPVDDLESEHRRFEEASLGPRRLVTLEKDGEAVGKFFFVADPEGYQVEVLQRGGRTL